MPLYDYDCQGCGKIHTALMNYEEYDASNELECEHCGGTVTKDNRIISGNIQKSVRGVGNGNFNSMDWS
jgi:putative FmdB family regulatory protein